MENKIHDILEQIFDSPFEIVQVISEPTKKWSSHSRCEDMECLFTKDRDILVMKDSDSPGSAIKRDYQLSLARWLRNEVPKGYLRGQDEQTLYQATAFVGKSRVEVVVILSKALEASLDGREKKAA